MYATVAITNPWPGGVTAQYHIQFPHQDWMALRADIASRLGIDLQGVNVGNLSNTPNEFFTYVDWESIAPVAPGRGPGSPAPTPPEYDPYPPVRPRPPEIIAPPTGVPPVVAPAAALLTFAALRTAVGLALARIIWFTLRKLAGGGTRVSYRLIPRWVRLILEGLGIGFVIELILGDDGPDDEQPGEVPPEITPPGAIVPAPPGGVVPVGTLPPEVAARVTRSWTANGTPFVGLTDGRVCALNKRGRWKCWWPKRPIVLYADGSANLKHFLKGDAALNKQAKAIAGALARRAPKVRVVCGKCRRVTCVCK